jgi:hypothetical protein
MTSFLRTGMGIAQAGLLAGLTASSACGGSEFGFFEPSLDLDGSADAKPASDGAQGGSAGAGGGSGEGGSGGAGGMGGTTTTGGTGGMGGEGTGGASGKSGADAGKSDGTASDGPGMNDAPSDNAALDASDVWTSDAVADGPRDGDSGRPTDAGDGATATDAKDADITSDNRIDSLTDAACSEPTTYYKDDDGDGFGTSTEMILSCTYPGSNWSVLGGDCRDDLATVKPYSVGSPDPPLYSGTGYSDATKPQSVSFDYDCTGAEDGDPSNAYGVNPDCSKLLNCTGVGYVAVNPSRMGPGINPYCGSTTVRRCSGVLPCGSKLETAAAYRCR